MTPLPHSADVINLFRRLGKQVFYVTNNSTKTRNDLVEKCRTLKFEATKNDILCTAHLSACYLQSLNFRKKVYVIGSEGETLSMTLRNLFFSEKTFQNFYMNWEYLKSISLEFCKYFSFYNFYSDEILFQIL